MEADEDLILISDLDEIPNLDSLNYSNIKKILLFLNKTFFIISSIYFIATSFGKVQSNKKKELFISSMVKKY